MIKPIDPQKLIPCIEAALARAKDQKNLERAVDKSQTISLAIGLLAGKQGITIDEAKSILFKASNDHRKKAEEIATDLIESSNQMAQIIQLLTQKK